MYDTFGTQCFVQAISWFKGGEGKEKRRLASNVILGSRSRRVTTPYLLVQHTGTYLSTWQAYIERRPSYRYIHFYLIFLERKQTFLTYLIPRTRTPFRKRKKWVTNRKKKSNYKFEGGYGTQTRCVNKWTKLFVRLSGNLQITISIRRQPVI